ncbi:PRD domain-containing protein [Thermosporothrix hazakensis]|jgi:transcriptional regulatory protein LevR|uniref:PRD domain-containing protein n=2 Tax=Thermosporothrix TaxID=768650 RepID=A0A326TZG7_THEHA|nr:PRD domain-containing protein [Thermosporothrix hazakensis]PZW22958.1 PRD domain-containing protein [Thermosporothrix hazakensis]BBH90050.1 hypothetical protein KTC_48010 [Thermosporothrix sp. COM3]GCE48271.1 hypothetical protein KTH_31400 [Thermosporothrix hazakensis]
MDQTIQERLQLFEQEEIVAPAIAGFVRNMLLWLEERSKHPCTEESAGTLASHLMMALERVRKGEGLGDTWDPDVHQEALQLSILQPWAEHIRAQAQQELHLSLPDEEVDFLLLHLGAFFLHYNDPMLENIGAS